MRKGDDIMMTFGRKIRIISALLILLSTIIIAVLGFYMSSNYIKSSMLMEIEKTLEIRKTDLELWLAQQMGVVDATVTSIETNEIYDNKKVEKYVKSIKEATSNSNITSIYIGTPDNTLIESSGYIPPADFDVTAREWYKAAMNSDEACVSEPYIDVVTKKIVITVSKSIERNGKKTAVLGIDISMDGALESIKNGSVSNGLNLFLLDKNMNIIYHPYVDKVSDTTLAKYVAVITKNNSNSTIKDFDNTKKIMQFCSVNLTDWTFVGTLPKSQISIEIYKLILIYTISTAIILVLCYILGIRLEKKLFKPLLTISEKVNKLSEGNLKISFDEPPVSKEVHLLTSSLNNMTNMLSTYISDIDISLRNVSEGKIDTISDIEYIGDFKLIKSSINNIRISLGELLNQLFITSDQLVAGANQVATGSEELSRGATDQASAIEELSASLNDVSSQIYKNAENTNKSKEFSKESGNLIEKGSHNMQEVLGAMSEIGDTSSEIAKIIKAVEDIAFQTNILALNAAVEAARAGQAGKGFAVVAEEVRSLASRSAEAAKTTTELIEKTTSAISNGKNIVDLTAKTFEEIRKSSYLLERLIDEISRATNDQAESIKQINVGVEQISSVIQNNTITAETSTATSEELLARATTLSNLVEKFKKK